MRSDLRPCSGCGKEQHSIGSNIDANGVQMRTNLLKGWWCPSCGKWDDPSPQERADHIERFRAPEGTGE